MIDIHSHILYGVDDGSKDVRTTQNMLEIAYTEGIRTIVATPHYHTGMSLELAQKKTRVFETTKILAQIIAPDFQLFLGGELYFSSATIQALDKGLAPTLNQTAYVLIEFPVYIEFSYIMRAVQDLQNAGYWPILAHVERYIVLKSQQNLALLSDMGALIQVNASTLLGRGKMQRFLLKCMKQGFVDLIATDAHGIDHRSPEIQDVILLLDKKLGKALREEMTELTPKKVIKGEVVK